MVDGSLADIPDGTDVFIDANVFLYGLGGRSAQSRQLLERCSREEIVGVTLLETVNEATHKFMLAEAFQKHLISKENAGELKPKAGLVVPSLSEYWTRVETLLSLNLLFLQLEEPVLSAAHVERSAAGLLTNDSMIVACMRACGLTLLASNDRDFDRVLGIKVFSPTDLT